MGRDTFLTSPDCAAPFGLVVIYGAASGPAPAIDPEMLLNKKGCLLLTRPSVFPHSADAATFRANVADLVPAAIAASMVRDRMSAPATRCRTWPRRMPPPSAGLPAARPC
ncbi:MAG: hypothetical protein MZV65_51975 [Chromatiales bacterium]|nr:hypothetical protein [Chromatiales bacterium]